jgi:hypothetical protein
MSLLLAIEHASGISPRALALHGVAAARHFYRLSSPKLAESGGMRSL